MSETLAAQLQKRRNQLGLTQGGLAESAGVSRPTIARIEAGQDINLGSLRKVLSALGLSIEVVGTNEGGQTTQL